MEQTMSVMTVKTVRALFAALALGLFVCFPLTASGQKTAPAADAADAAPVDASQVLIGADATGKKYEINSGDTAWMLVSTALVLMMTGPGLALFYGGLVRRKNVLSTMMQSFILMAVVSIVWAIIGYSLAFDAGNAFFGGFHFAFLNNVGGVPCDYAATIPHTTWMVYQLMFAIITPALISGAYAERMKFSSMLVFSVLWLLFIYCPMAHMVWARAGC
jgi:Amt family ammonium transporter